MIIRVSPNLKRQEIWANGLELASVMGFDRNKGKRILTYPTTKKVLVHTFTNPILMTDSYRISTLKPTLRDTLLTLYGMKPRVVEYDGVDVFWDHTHLNVWCPSIDTLVYAKALKKVLKREAPKTAIEIGCGSGFLSKFALATSRSLVTLLVNDINPYAIKSAMDNIHDKWVMYYTGNGVDKIQHMKFDLMICNPPYIPRPRSIDDNPYEGIGLLNHLVHKGQGYLNKNGIIVMNISSLCWDFVFHRTPRMRMRILGRMHVPLKVNNVLNNQSWLTYLCKHCGLKKTFKHGYEYWQDIIIVELRA